MNNQNQLTAIQQKYPECNLLMPSTTEVQLNPFYKFTFMNFNDEGQKRGFWIHDIVTDCPYDTPHLDASHFYETPYREFLTIRLDSDEIELYNTTGGLSLEKCTAAKDKIVRVLYSCTEEQNKALNRAQIEHEKCPNSIETN
jgi:hypothetical protein